MSDWQDISTAPTDGSKVYVRRMHEGRLVREGWAVFGPMAADAPMRSPAPGGLYAPIPADNQYADIPGWCTEDRRYHFPTPTEWLPARAALDRNHRTEQHD